MHATTQDSTNEDDPGSVLRGLNVDCCVIGGGPGGMMTGLLLARAGISVAVLERHPDFSGDFCGDMIAPSTLEVMSELGMLEDLLSRPHLELKELTGDIGGTRARFADFSELKAAAPFVALMPQSVFLDFVAREARKLPGFRLLMACPATSLRFRANRVIGVRADLPEGPLEIRARVVVATDGHDSLLRVQAGLSLREYGPAVDVLSFRLTRQPTDRPQAFGHVGRGRALVLLDRGPFWQCALVAVEKGTVPQHERKCMAGLRKSLEDILPLPPERLKELDGSNEVELLSVKPNRLEHWARPGLLCIGDAAHATSPLGGVGINLAIQDAVATARILTPPLRAGRAPSLRHLKRVQRRRSLATRLTIRFQLFVQNRFLGDVMHDRVKGVPILIRLLNRSRRLQHLVGRVIGLGLRPEHVPPSAAAEGRA